MKTVEINAIISEIEAIAAPHETEILCDARAYLFEESSNYVKKGLLTLPGLSLGFYPQLMSVTTTKSSGRI